MTAMPATAAATVAMKTSRYRWPGIRMLRINGVVVDRKKNATPKSALGMGAAATLAPKSTPVAHGPSTAIATPPSSPRVTCDTIARRWRRCRSMAAGSSTHAWKALPNAMTAMMAIR